MGANTTIELNTRHLIIKKSTLLGSLLWRTEAKIHVKGSTSNDGMVSVIKLGHPLVNLGEKKTQPVNPCS